MYSEYFLYVTLVLWVMSGLAAFISLETNHAISLWMKYLTLIAWVAFGFVMVGMRAPWLGTDTIAYQRIFDGIVFGDVEPNQTEFGFYWLVRGLAFAFDTPFLFIVFQLVFIMSLFVAIYRLGGLRWPLLLFFYLGCFFYYNASINVIRSGVAIAILLAGVSLLAPASGEPTRRQVITGAVLCFASSLLHYFNLLYCLLVVAALFVPATRVTVCVWGIIVAVVLSGIDPTSLATRLLPSTEGITTRKATLYLDAASQTGYEAGLRWDFLLFTSVFLLFPIYYYFVRRYRNPQYQKYVRLYILSSALFISSFYAPFSDRVGMLSFFLIPPLICLPIMDPLYPGYETEQWIGFATAIGFGVASFIYMPMSSF